MFDFLKQTTIRLLDEAEALDQLSRELHTKVSEVVSAFDSNQQTLACPISLTHRHLGPVTNVEALLPGRVALLILLNAIEYSRRAPPIGYINPEHCFVYYGVEGNLE